MPIKKTLPDGAVVEVLMCGKVYGPDSPVNLNYGTSYPYYRVNGGPWVFSSIRNLHHILNWLEGCSSVEDFLWVEQEIGRG